MRGFIAEKQLMNPYMTFIIPALNEAAYIGEAVASIHLAMDCGPVRPGYEVVVVDDDSADSTVEIASQHQARVIQVRKRNIAAVRNEGARHAQGGILIFVDADTQVGHALLQEAIGALVNGATWGTACAVPADRCPLWARLGLEVYNQLHVRLRQCGYGFFFFVQKEAFEQIGGFPERTLEGEDVALSKLLVERYGPPTVLRSRVATSARKAGQFGFWYHVKMLWLTLRYGDEAYTRPEISDYRDGDLRIK